MARSRNTHKSFFLQFLKVLLNLFHTNQVEGMAKLLQVWKRIEESLSTSKEKILSRRNSAECADLGDMDQCCEGSLFMEMLPREMHFLILSFVGPVDMRSIAMVNKVVLHLTSRIDYLGLPKLSA